MPRQTFATREFFVNVCEHVTQQGVLELPRTFHQMRFVAENAKLHSILFMYEPDDVGAPVQVSVSVLPLNDACTKVTVHGSYTNGCAFNHDKYMTLVMLNVEAALQAAISGSTAFEPMVPKKKLAQRCQHVKQNTAVFITNAFKVRRLLPPSHS
jgi:hypothetical protein